jgi:hypothetical protein
MNKPESDTNVLKFPVSRIINPHNINSEQLDAAKERSVRNFADQVLQEMTHNMMMDFNEVGLDTSRPEFNKDFHYLVVVLEALIARTLDIEHPMHQMIDEEVTFTIED